MYFPLIEDRFAIPGKMRWERKQWSSCPLRSQPVYPYTFPGQFTEWGIFLCQSVSWSQVAISVQASYCPRHQRTAVDWSGWQVLFREVTDWLESRLVPPALASTRTLSPYHTQLYSQIHTHKQTHTVKQCYGSKESAQWGDNTWRNSPLKGNNNRNNHLPPSLSVSILLKISSLCLFSHLKLSFWISSETVIG